MNEHRYILDEAAEKLHEYTGLQIRVKGGVTTNDMSLIIDNERFGAIVETSVTNGSKGGLLMRAKDLAARSGRPVIVVTRYIPHDISKEYAGEKMNFLDVSGN